MSSFSSDPQLFKNFPALYENGYLAVSTYATVPLLIIKAIAINDADVTHRPQL